MTYTKLRIKIKSLAAESRIIKDEERKLTRAHKPFIDGKTGRTIRVGRIPEARARQVAAEKIENMEAEYQSLRRHRTIDVRNEARAAQIAYGFLRGKPYARIETPKVPLPDGLRAMARGIAFRFGSRNLTQVEKDMTLWLDGPEETTEAA